MTAIYIAYLFAIIVLSILPGSEGPPLIPNIDKVMHFVAYSGLAILSMIVFRKVSSRILGLTAGICLGIALEFVQAQVPGRYVSVLDALANAIGIGAGAIIFLKFQQLFLQVAAHISNKKP